MKRRFGGICLSALLTVLVLSCQTPGKYPERKPGDTKLEDKSAEVDVDVRSSSERPQHVTTPPMPDVVTFAGDTVPLHRDDVRDALEKELTINTFLHSRTMNMIRRFERWKPLIEKELTKNQVPKDFIYLAAAESDFNNTAISDAGAVGMWQFMKGTAKDFNLPVDRFVDMRRDPEQSTKAACKYFLKAYSRFENWPIVAATYNRGISGIGELLEDQQVDSFYDLHTNEETSRYLFRILALKLILENPKSYGYFINPEDNYKPYEFEEVEITSDIDNLVEFAREHGTTYKELRLLNPWFNNTSNYKLNVPRNETYRIRLPKNKNPV